MKKAWLVIRHWLHIGSRDEGQSMIEYGLIIALIAVVVVVALTAMGGKISALFTSISSSL